MVRIQRENSRSGLRPARWVSSRCVCVLTRPGTRTASGNSTRRAPGGLGTCACAATAAILPSSATRTAPSVMGGAVTGWTEPARILNIRSRRHARPEGLVDRAGLCRLGAGIEPIPMPHFLRAERRREIAVRPVHFERDQRIGPHPIGGGRAARLLDTHARRPRRVDNYTSTCVVLQSGRLCTV